MAATMPALISLRDALTAGYRVQVFDDGVAHVTRPDAAHTYHVNLWEPAHACDCPDMAFRGGSHHTRSGQPACKHALWIQQTTLCKSCGSPMLYVKPHDLGLFECVNLRCQDARDARLVAEERKARRKAA